MLTNQEHIAARSIPEPNTGCWLWLGSVNNWGYGRTSFSGSRERSAHRLSFAAHHGPIPPRRIVMHKCDTPACVNPAHLILGDQHANMRDMVRKRRNADNRGERSATAKLSNARVTDIRERHNRGESVSLLAREHSVSRRAVRFVITGATWA